MFTQHTDGGGYNLFRIGKRPQRLIQVAEETDLLFYHLAICDVARDYRETAEPPFVIMYRGDDSASPETRTVLADLPAALFIAPFGRRDLLDALRLAALDILPRVENRKVAPNDLIRPIS